MKRLILVMLVGLAACGDSSDPLPSGPIRLTAEVRHVDPGNYTCEWRVTADAAELSDPAMWVRGTLDYSDTQATVELTPATFWRTGQIGPDQILVGDSWYGHGSTGAWPARVTWSSEARGETDTTSVTLLCGRAASEMPWRWCWPAAWAFAIAGRLLAQGVNSGDFNA